MKIHIDEKTGEYYLRFVDPKDNVKKSRYLRVLSNSGTEYVNMSIVENSNKPTESQKGIFKAFIILIKDYSGYEYEEVKKSIYAEMDLSDEVISTFSKAEYAEFIERLFRYCSYNIGIEVQQVNGKLKIIK